MTTFNYDHKSIQMRRGTSSEWREFGDKCVPLEAEICVELMQNPDGTVNKHVGVKVGNGIDSYEQLPYVILNEETDPIFTSHPAFNITQEDIEMWNQASVEPGEQYGQVTRWDGTEWVPTSIILLKDVEGIEVRRNVVPFKGSALDIGAENLTFKAGYFDSLDTGTINVDGNATIGGDISVDGSATIGGDIDVDGSINIGGNANIEGNIDINGNINIDGGIEIGSEIVDIEDFMRKSATNIVTEDWKVVLYDNDGVTPVIGIGPRGLIVQGIYSQDGILAGQGDAPGDKPSGSEDNLYGVSAPKINAQQYVVTPEIFAPQVNNLQITVDDDKEVQIHGDVVVDDSVTASEFIGDGAKITGIVTDQLADVQSEGANRDDFLIYSGTQWVAESFHIETELNFMGSWNFTTAPPTNPEKGDLYINDTDGAMPSGWGPLAGTNVLVGNMVGYSEAKGRWYLLGDVASGAVVQVREGDCIVVDETQPDRPVVGLTPACQADIAKGVEAWGWGNHADEGYATEDWVNNLGYLTGITAGTAIIVDPSTNPLEPKISVSLGTTAADAAAGNHLHAQYLETETDPTVPQHVKNITTTQIANWNTAYGWGNHATQGYLKSGDIPGTDLSNYYTKSESDGKYEPKFAKNNAFNKSFGTAAGTVAQGDHTHSQYLTSGSLSGYATESWVTSGFQPKGNYALVGASYTKAESDAKYELKGAGGGGLPDGDWHCTGSITAKGNITAYSSSDERLKDDITAMPVGLIDGISPVTWEWKEGGKKSGGVVAQQLQQCGLGNWVHEAPDGTLGVDYNALIGVLVAEVQSLKARVEELEK